MEPLGLNRGIAAKNLGSLRVPLQVPTLGFGVPYFNNFFPKGTVMKQKFILFSPLLLKSPVSKVPDQRAPYRVLPGF